MTFYLLFIAFLGFAVLASFWQLLVSLSKKKKYRYLKHYVVIDEFDDGPTSTPISITGTVRTSTQPLITPNTKQNCISYIIFEQITASKNNSTSWREINRSSIPFWIVDRRGKGICINDHKNIESDTYITQVSQSQNQNNQNKSNSFVSNLVSLASSLIAPKFKEVFIPLGARVNFFGIVSQDSIRGITLAERKDYPTIITNKTLNELQQKYFGWRSYIPTFSFILITLYFIYIVISNLRWFGF